jgi:hypothetical protein
MGGRFKNMPTRGIAKIICDGILAGDSKEKIVQDVTLANIEAKRPRKRVDWYRWQLRKIGALAPFAPKEGEKK